MAVGPFFHMLPTNKLIGLREVWPDTYEYLDKHAKEFFEDYGFSGYCILELVRYLKDKKNIDLGDSKYHLLFPTALYNATWFLDKSLKDKYAGRLDSTLFSDKEVKSVLGELFDADSEESAKAILKGVDILSQSLEMVSDHAVMILQIIP